MGDMIKKQQFIQKKNLHFITNAFCVIFVIVALTIFIIPNNMLSTCEICKNFVNFMKQYFPNIQIFSNISPIPEATEFYVSIMWIISILMSIWVVA